jgi:hypothetical protein
MVDSRNAFIFFSTNDFKIVWNCLKIIEQPCPWSSEWKPKFCYSNHLWMWHKYIASQYCTCTFLHNINWLQCVACMLKISVDYYCLRLHDCGKSNTWSVLSTLCQTQWKKLKLVCESLVIITLNCFWVQLELTSMEASQNISQQYVLFSRLKYVYEHESEVPCSTLVMGNMMPHLHHTAPIHIW